MPLTNLPPMPREFRIALKRIGNSTEAWMDYVQQILANVGAIAWSIVDKSGSNLTDIETRRHNDLQVRDAVDAHPWDSITKTGSDIIDIEARDHSDLENLLGGSDLHHVQSSERAELTAIDALSTGMVAKTADATFAARTITGTSGEITVDNGNGVSDNPTISLPDVISTPRKFGDDTDNTEFETDGTVKFNGEAIVWKDVIFPMAPPKTTGAGNPTLVTWNGNIRGYTFAVGDAHDFDPQEFTHDGKEGSTATWHIHFINRTNVAATRTVKYQLEYSQANRNGVYPAPTTVSAEFTIPANTAVNTHFAEDIASFTTGSIAGQMYVRLTRIASSGTEPANDPVVSGIHYHYQLDTVGSRDIFLK